MKYWILKDTKFGYRYTTNKSTRKIILDYFNDYLYNLILSKGNKSDKLLIVGGLFSNTNPSIIAITDAYNIILKFSKIINIILITSDKDIRLFDGKSYSTLNLLKSIQNIEIISSENIIHFNNFEIDVNNGLINMNNDNIKIPNSIQFEKDDNKAGIFINNENGKYIILPNNFSPKHRTIKINSFADFDNIEDSSDFIHLEINNSLLEENKQLININIFKIKPISVKYIDIKNSDSVSHININNNFNIIDVINEEIKDNENTKKQFERILNIYNNTTKLT